MYTSSGAVVTEKKEKIGGQRGVGKQEEVARRPAHIQLYERAI
jgi:hypothetical protein